MTQHEDWVPGDRLRSLAPKVYEECRRIARDYFRSERVCASLQPTVLVHDAWLRLTRSIDLKIVDEAHLRALMAMTMRRVLIEHGRAEHGRGVRVTLGGDLPGSEPKYLDVLALCEAMEALEQHDRRLCRAVECRVFGDMSFGQLAPLLGVKERQAQNLYVEGIAWLTRHLAV